MDLYEVQIGQRVLLPLSQMIGVTFAYMLFQFRLGVFAWLSGPK